MNTSVKVKLIGGRGSSKSVFTLDHSSDVSFCYIVGSDYRTTTEVALLYLVVHATITLAPCYPLMGLQVN